MQVRKHICTSYLISEGILREFTHDIISWYISGIGILKLEKMIKSRGSIQVFTNT